MKALSILFGDANATRRELFQLCFEESPRDIASARIVAFGEVHETLRQEVYDALVLAVDSEDGFETLLRTSRRYPGLPVIAVTSNPYGWSDRLIMEGTEDILPENEIAPETLVMRLRTAIARRHHRRGSARQDALTGLLTEDTLLPLATHLLRDIRRDGRRASVAMVSFDGIDAVMEAHTASAADTVMLKAAEFLQRTLPQSAILARTGYQECTILALDINPHALRLPVAKAAVRLHQWLPANYPHITALFGSCHAQRGETVERMMAFARESMCENVFALGARS